MALSPASPLSVWTLLAALALAVGTQRQALVVAFKQLGPEQLLEPLEVGLRRFAARTWTRRADGVGDLDDRRLQAGVFDLLVVGRDSVHDLRREVVAEGDLGADRRVRTLDLVVDGLADVVRLPGPAQRAE